jgi:hypothetical protein
VNDGDITNLREHEEHDGEEGQHAPVELGVVAGDRDRA